MSELTGAQLKKLREERHIPLEEVAVATRIRLSILQDLEDEEYAELASSTQAKGFLRIYAQFLGIKDNAPLPQPLTPPPPPNEPISKAEPQKEPVEAPEIPLQKERRTWKSSRQLNQEASQVEQPGEEDVVPQPAVQDPQPEPEGEPKPESQKILEKIGRELAARRRYLNLPWEVIVEHNKIPKHNLKAVEKGDIDALSGSMQFKGILQAYARFLNLDVESIMIRYAEALQARRQEASTTRRPRRAQGKRLSPFLVTLKRFFTLDLFFGTLLILGIVGFLVWGITRMSEQRANEPEITATLPAVADILLATPSAGLPTATLPATEDEPGLLLPTPTPFFSMAGTDSALEIFILARQNVWIRVYADEELEYQGRLEVGTVVSFTGEESIEFETGNAAAVELVFQKQAIGTLPMTIGTPAHLLFTVDGFTEVGIGTVDIEEELTPTEVP